MCKNFPVYVDNNKIFSLICSIPLRNVEYSGIIIYFKLKQVVKYPDNNVLDEIWISHLGIHTYY